jgi:hypothetical protein
MRVRHRSGGSLRSMSSLAEGGPRSRSLVPRACPALALALLLVAATDNAAEVARGAATVARGSTAGRELDIREEGRLRFITSYGSELIDEGAASGTLPGKLRVHFLYSGDPDVAARFTISTSGGSISGRASARLADPTSPAPSFHGTFRTTGGSGRYAHVSGTGEISGVFTRRGYALAIQTIGRLRY